MKVLRAIHLITMLMFLLEVLNPSTAFVREKAKPVSRLKQAKIEKKWHETQIPAQQIEAPDPELDSDDGDFLAGSAILPAPPPQSAPLVVERSILLLISGAPLDYSSSIQRPPSLA